MGQKTKYRVYTEYVHSRHISEIVLKYFSSFSIFTGIRHFDHHKERCLVVEIITSETHAEANVISICQEINADNQQECCLVTSEKVNVMVIAERRQSVLNPAM